MIEIGKMTMETAKSLNPVLTIRLFPVRVRGWQKNSVDKEKVNDYDRLTLRFMSSKSKQASTKIYRSDYQVIVNKAINFNVESIRLYVSWSLLVMRGERGCLKRVALMLTRRRNVKRLTQTKSINHEFHKFSLISFTLSAFVSLAKRSFYGKQSRLLSRLLPRSQSLRQIEKLEKKLIQNRQGD